KQGIGGLTAFDRGRRGKSCDAFSRRPALPELAASWLDGGPDVGETGGRQPFFDFAGCGRTPEAPAPQRRVRPQLRRPPSSVYHVGDADASTRLQHTERLAVDLFLVGNKVDDAIRDDDVRSVVGDRQVLDLAEAELDILGSDALGVGPRFAPSAATCR